MKLSGDSAPRYKNNAAVLVSTYNRPKALNLVLGGLASQSLSPAQVIVADDGSTNDTKRIIDYWKSQGLPVEHCWHKLALCSPEHGWRKRPSPFDGDW
jgi:hypothetical protein